MRLILSPAEQRQFARTVQVLVSPFDEPIEDWRRAVLESLSQLLAADMGGFILPAAGGASPYTLHNLPDAFARDFFRTSNLSEGSRALIVHATQANIWSTRSFMRDANMSIERDWFGSREYREFYGRYGIQEGLGYVVRAAAPGCLLASGDEFTATLPIGAVLTCFRSVYVSDELDERGLAILRLLQPALDAGVAGRVRLAGLRDTLGETLDALSEGVQVSDATGRRIHVNAALERLLEAEPGGDAIRAAVERVSGGLRTLLRQPQEPGNPQDVAAVSVEVLAGDDRYQVSGQLTGGGGAGPRVVVSVVRLTPPQPTLESLRERWGLSPQEARVALLIAQGWSNARIAGELQLSSATVRHYTETVFAKLDVHSRAAAAHRLLHG